MLNKRNHSVINPILLPCHPRCAICPSVGLTVFQLDIGLVWVDPFPCKMKSIEHLLASSICPCSSRTQQGGPSSTPPTSYANSQPPKIKDRDHRPAPISTSLHTCSPGQPTFSSLLLTRLPIQASRHLRKRKKHSL